jgi:ribonuclease I
VNRLTELSEQAFMRIESKNAADLQQQRIEAAFRNKFGHLNDEGVQISIAQGQFTLTYKNGIELKIGAYEHNSEVVFTNSKVTIPYKFDVDKLVEGLKNI